MTLKQWGVVSLVGGTIAAALFIFKPDGTVDEVVLDGTTWSPAALTQTIVAGTDPGNLPTPDPNVVDLCYIRNQRDGDWPDGTLMGIKPYGSNWSPIERGDQAGNRTDFMVTSLRLSDEALTTIQSYTWKVKLVDSLPTGLISPTPTPTPIP